MFVILASTFSMAYHIRIIKKLSHTSIFGLKLEPPMLVTYYLLSISKRSIIKIMTKWESG